MIQQVLLDIFFSSSYSEGSKDSFKKCFTLIWPSTSVIFSEITLSKPFSINRVINIAHIPIDNPITDKVLAVLTNPLLESDLMCFRARERLSFNFF